jgi:hypothetical protein
LRAARAVYEAAERVDVFSMRIYTRAGVDFENRLHGIKILLGYDRGVGGVGYDLGVFGLVPDFADIDWVV